MAWSRRKDVVRDDSIGKFGKQERKKGDEYKKENRKEGKRKGQPKIKNTIYV